VPNGQSNGGGADGSRQEVENQLGPGVRLSPPPVVGREK